MSTNEVIGLVAIFTLTLYPLIERSIQTMETKGLFPFEIIISVLVGSFISTAVMNILVL